MADILTEAEQQWAEQEARKLNQWIKDIRREARDRHMEDPDPARDDMGAPAKLDRISVALIDERLHLALLKGEIKAFTMPMAMAAEVAKCHRCESCRCSAESLVAYIKERVAGLARAIAELEPAENHARAMRAEELHEREGG